jgi:hypothetical protein
MATKMNKVAIRLNAQEVNILIEALEDRDFGANDAVVNSLWEALKRTRERLWEQEAEARTG